MRKYAVLAAAIAVTALVPAAHAETTEFGYNDGQRGFVNVTVTPGLHGRAALDDMYAVNGECHYDLLFGSSDGTMTIALAGRAVAGPRLFLAGVATRTTAPIGTVVTCSVRSGAGGLLYSTSRSALGPTAALAATVDVPVDDVRICVTAYGLFSDGQYITLDEHCRPS